VRPERSNSFMAFHSVWRALGGASGNGQMFWSEQGQACPENQI